MYVLLSWYLCIHVLLLMYTYYDVYTYLYQYYAIHIHIPYIPPFPSQLRIVYLTTYLYYTYIHIHIYYYTAKPTMPAKNIIDKLDDDNEYIIMPYIHDKSFIARRKDNNGELTGM